MSGEQMGLFLRFGKDKLRAPLQGSRCPPGMSVTSHGGGLSHAGPASLSQLKAATYFVLLSASTLASTKMGGFPRLSP